MMFYDNLKTICEQKQRNVLSVISECGVVKDILDGQKNGTIPSGNVIIKLAEHLDVSADRLLGIEKNTLTYDIEQKAIRMAFSILKNQRMREENNRHNQPIIAFDTLIEHLNSLTETTCTGELHDLQDEIGLLGALMAVCRKAVIDGFPLHNYWIFEIPVSGDISVIIFSENEPNDKHEIVFNCLRFKSVAVPQKYYLNNCGLCCDDCDNCFEALHTIEWATQNC